jgi:hypothetical protein
VFLYVNKTDGNMALLRTATSALANAGINPDDGG